MENNKFTNIVYFTVSQFIKYKIHLGFFSRFLDSTLSFFLFKSFNFYFFNLNFTILYLKVVLNIINQLISRRNQILFSIKSSFKFFFQFFNSVNSISYISNSWLPGFLTNFKLIKNSIFFSFFKSILLSYRFSFLLSSLKKIWWKRNDFVFDLKLKKYLLSKRNQKVNSKRLYKIFRLKKKKYLEFSLKKRNYNLFLIKLIFQYLFFKKKSYFFNFKEYKTIPSFVLFSNIENNHFGINEAFKLKIPFCTFLDLNLNIFSLNYFILGNSKNYLSLSFFFFLITKSLLIGTRLEKKNFKDLIRFFSSSFVFQKNFLSYFYFYKFFNFNKFIFFYLKNRFINFTKLKLKKRFFKLLKIKWFKNLYNLFNYFFKSSNFFLYDFSFLNFYFFKKIHLNLFNFFFKIKFIRFLIDKKKINLKRKKNYNSIFFRYFYIFFLSSFFKFPYFYFSQYFHFNIFFFFKNLIFKIEKKKILLLKKKKQSLFFINLLVFLNFFFNFRFNFNNLKNFFSLSNKLIKSNNKKVTLIKYFFKNTIDLLLNKNSFFSFYSLLRITHLTSSFGIKTLKKYNYGKKYNYKKKYKKKKYFFNILNFQKKKKKNYFMKKNKKKQI